MKDRPSAVQQMIWSRSGEEMNWKILVRKDDTLNRLEIRWADLGWASIGKYEI
jgi:hypothetical protein